MVGTTLTIEREIEDARSTRDTGIGSKREDQPSSSLGKRGRRLLLHTSFKTRAKIWHMRRDCPRDKDPRTLGQRSPS